MCVVFFVGCPTDSGVRRCAVQQRLAESCTGCYGAGSDGHSSHVVQGLVPQTAAILHLRAHQALHRKGKMILRKSDSHFSVDESRAD